MKVVINACYGGFSISYEAAKFMAELGDEQAIAVIKDYEEECTAFEYYKKHRKLPDGTKDKYRTSMFDISIKYHERPMFHGYGYIDGFPSGFARDSEALVKAVEALGEKANGSCAKLRVVDVPDDVKWLIDEYDGYEHVEEEHRTWS